MRGEKHGFYCTSIMREFPFPVFKGEKYVPESTVWNRIATKYKCRFGNDYIDVCEYQPGGLSSRAWYNAVKSPQGMRLCFREILAMRRRLPLVLLFRRAVSFVRFSFHCRLRPLVQLREIRSEAPHRLFLWLFALLPGYLLFCRDQMKLAAMGEQGV